MNTRLLEYFIAVAEHRSFRKAADICGVSQPALSIQLKKLEEILGVDLFERTNKSVMLTEAGKEVLSSSRQLLTDVETLKKRAQLFSDPYSGEIHIGAFPTLAPSLFPRLIPELASTYPNIKFHLVEEKTEDLLEMLADGKLDAAFLAEPEEHPLIMSQTLYTEHFLLAAPEKMQLPNEISIKDLKGHNLMLLAEGHCLRDQALEVCEMAELNDAVDYSASSLITLLHMVQLGNGITLVPERSITKIKGVKYLKFKKNPPGRRIAIFWRKSSVREDLLLEIADDIKREFGQ
ncbi:MAG: LysR substrate-binding domain-containing protein [Lentisphaeraceae bacterium]|nr:LysR substrate-binding domain-containing protein [Lentisphaeraceae bacterium]